MSKEAVSGSCTSPIVKKSTLQNMAYSPNSLQKSSFVKISQNGMSIFPKESDPLTILYFMQNFKV